MFKCKNSSYRAPKIWMEKDGKPRKVTEFQENAEDYVMDGEVDLMIGEQYWCRKVTKEKQNQNESHVRWTEE